METRERIVEFVKVKGPVLPVQIAKEIGSDILMASAHLAELTASSRMKISTIKVGGSPLYYLAGQEAMLQKFTGNMNDKEKKAYDLLNQQKILKDSEQEPVIRVALRAIRDFAVPLNVTHNENKEVFWKWYLANEQEAEQLIKSKLKIDEKSEKKIDDKPVEKKSVQEAAQKPEQKKAEEQAAQLKEKPKATKKYRPRDSEDSFLKDITKFFEKNRINVVSSETIKRNFEIDFIVEIPSVVGNLQYYCKARNKKKISDSDLSNAYVRGQLKRLPVLVLSPGDLSGKAEEMIGKELSNLTFKKI